MASAGVTASPARRILKLNSNQCRFRADSVFGLVAGGRYVNRELATALESAVELPFAIRGCKYGFSQVVDHDSGGWQSRLCSEHDRNCLCSRILRILQGRRVTAADKCTRVSAYNLVCIPCAGPAGCRLDLDSAASSQALVWRRCAGDCQYRNLAWARSP